MNGFLVCWIISLIIYTIIYDWAFIGLFLLILSGYFLLSYIFVPSSAEKFNTASRKAAIATWSDPNSPECHGCFKVRISKALNFLEEFKKLTGKKITLTHLLLKITGDIFVDFRDFSGRIAFGNYIPYDAIDIGCFISIDEGKDQSFLCIREANEKKLIDICNEMEEKLKSTREVEALRLHNKMNSILKLLPTTFVGVLIELLSFIAVSIGLDIPIWNFSKFPGGSMIVLNLGNGESRGFEHGFTPFWNFFKVSGIFALNSIREEAIIDNGQIVVDKMLTFFATVDHRFGDGTRATKFMNQIKLRLENPEVYVKI